MDLKLYNEIEHHLSHIYDILLTQVHISKPDMGLIMKAKSSNLGLKAPAILATRLKLVAELAKDLL